MSKFQVARVYYLPRLRTLGVKANYDIRILTKEKA